MKYNQKRIAVEVPVASSYREKLASLDGLIGTRCKTDVIAYYYAPRDFVAENTILSVIYEMKKAGASVYHGYA